MIDKVKVLFFNFLILILFLFRSDSKATAGEDPRRYRTLQDRVFGHVALPGDHQ